MITYTQINVPDHLPVFYTVSNRLPSRQEAKYFRDFSRFNKDLLLSDLEAINFNNLIAEDVNQSSNNVINAIQSYLINMHLYENNQTKKENSQLNPGYLTPF